MVDKTGKYNLRERERFETKAYYMCRIGDSVYTQVCMEKITDTYNRKKEMLRWKEMQLEAQ